jgi:ABC-type multidrug transport system ATPase subunit
MSRVGPRTYLASLGGSGSGKTTLLNAIAHRLSGLPVEGGEVAYFAASQASTGRHGASVGQSPVLSSDGPASHGRKLSKSEVKKRIGFVRQQDYLVECLTVRETLTYVSYTCSTGSETQKRG